MKQTEKIWYQGLSTFLIQQGFERSTHDYCLFLKNKKDEKLFVLTWVDDFVIAGNGQTEINKIKNSLESKFKLHERGDLEWFLGMRILKTEKGITLDQEKYTQKILEQFHMQYCKRCKIPAKNNLKLEKAHEDLVRGHSQEFRSQVGSILYLSKHINRPDIMWDPNFLSPFVNDPTVVHFNNGKRVLRCLQHTKYLRLFFSSTSNSTLVGKTDADWNGDVNDRRSTTRYYFKLRDSGGSVIWQVKKQPTVSLSSCEAEFQGLSSAVQKTILRGFPRELGYEQCEPTTIGEDNQNCTNLATKPVLYKRPKHIIDKKYHFIRKRVDDNSINLIYTPTDEMAADLLTKSLQ